MSMNHSIFFVQDNTAHYKRGRPCITNIIALALFGASPIMTAAQDNLLVENLTTRSAQVVTYNQSSHKKTGAKSRTVPPGGAATVERPTSSFFNTGQFRTQFALAAFSDSATIPENTVESPFYCIINKKTKTIFVQELGTSLGTTAAEETVLITLKNKTTESLFVALYYDDGKTAHRWGQTQQLEAGKSLTIQRPERKCRKEKLGVCTTYFDRNVYFSTKESDLTPTLAHKTINFINVGSTKGPSFVIYTLKSTLLGAAPQSIWQAQKGVELVQELLKKDTAAVKELFASLNYPGKDEVATVQERPALSGAETRFRIKRQAEFVRPACEKLYQKLYNKPLPAHSKLPTIAFCISGGGCRAMFATAGMLAAAEELNVLPFVSYIAALSGSTWAVTSWLYSQKSAREHLDALCTQFTKGIWTDFNVLEVQEALHRKDIYEQPQSIIDLYGALLADKLCKPYAPQRNPNLLLWGDELPQIAAATTPFPLCTAVTPGGFTDRTLNDNPYNYYLWLTVDPYTVSLTGPDGQQQKSIPSWAFGRTFAQGTSTNKVPPFSVGYLLGIFGSAISFNTYDAARIAIDPKLSAELISVISRNKTLALQSQQRASPAKVPNFAAPGLMTLVDAGVSLNDPLPPLLEHERKVDIIIMMNASESGGLAHVARYVSQHKIAFPALDLHAAGKQPYIIARDPNNIEAPIVVHLPLRGRPTYDNGWDPFSAWWTNTLNFVYSEANARKLAGLSRAMLQDAQDALEKTIGAWLHEHITQDTAVSAQQVAIG